MVSPQTILAETFHTQSDNPVIMPLKKLTQDQLAQLSPLETQLKRAVASAEAETAIELTGRIQVLFGTARSHHRLLRDKLWMFEACLDDNRLEYTESGLVGIRKLSNPATRIYLEASSLLAVCVLRQKRSPEAKKLIREVIASINNIASDRTRHKFQKRLVDRLEEECILAELIGTGTDKLDQDEIEARAILLVQRNSDDEILRLLGNSIPVAGIKLLGDVRNYSINQLPEPDKKLLPSPETVQNSTHIGKLTFAILRRIAWKTFCKPSSPIYRLWSQQIPKVFNEGYFSAAAISAFSNFRIGLPILASGLVALAMKYSAEEFCALAQPRGLMISPNDKAE